MRELLNAENTMPNSLQMSKQLFYNAKIFFFGGGGWGGRGGAERVGL